MFGDEFIPRVAGVAEGHNMGLPLQHRFQCEEDKRCTRHGETEVPVSPPPTLGDAAHVIRVKCGPILQPPAVKRFAELL